MNLFEFRVPNLTFILNIALPDIFGEHWPSNVISQIEPAPPIVCRISGLLRGISLPLTLSFASQNIGAGTPANRTCPFTLTKSLLILLTVQTPGTFSNVSMCVGARNARQATTTANPANKAAIHEAKSPRNHCPKENSMRLFYHSDHTHYL